VVEESRNGDPFEVIALLPANATAYHVPDFPISAQPQHASYRVTAVTETAGSNPALFEVDIPPFPGLDATPPPPASSPATSSTTPAPPNTGGGLEDGTAPEVIGLAALALLLATAALLRRRQP
jgi:hypothetical protein